MATEDDLASEEKPPKSLNELLKLSLKLSEQELKEWGTSHQPMDEERRKWLEEAMEKFFQNDDTKRLKECTEVLKKPFPSDEEVDEQLLKEKSESLEELQFLVELSDNAKDLHILGGLKQVIEHLRSRFSSLRWKAAEVIATACQNNPFCQNAVTQLNGIPLLVDLLNSDDVDIVRVKALYALSSLIKSCETSSKIFMNADGATTLLKVLNSDLLKLRIKAAFLIRGLILDDANNLNTFLKGELVTKLVSILKNRHDDSHEHVVNLLCDIVAQNKSALLESRKPEHGLRKLFSERRDMLRKNDPERYEEEVECYEKLLKLCFPKS